MAGPSLRTLRRSVARALGAPPWFAASTGSTSTLVCAAPFRSTELPVSDLAYAYIFCPDLAAPRQRRVKQDGLTPGTGTITVDDTFGAAVSAGTVFEVHPKMPAISEGNTSGEATMPGLHDAIHDSLKHLLVLDDAQTITLVSGRRSYDASALIGLDRPERLVDIRAYDAVSGAYVSVKARHPWEFRESGSGNTLFFEKPFRFGAGSFTAKVVAWRPALLTVNGTASLTGPVNESDTVVPEEKDILPGALAFCYQALAARSVGPAKANYERLHLYWRAEARKARNYDQSTEVAAPVASAPEVAA